MDSVARDLIDNIQRRGVTRLLIDGAEGMRNIVMHPERAPSFLIALVNELRVRNVTTFITEQLPFFRNHLNAADGASASAMYENIILLEQVNTPNGMQREISVMKLRENDYDAAKHILSISSAGVAVTGHAYPPTPLPRGGNQP
jgi:circadian clock protein KaiC